MEKPTALMLIGIALVGSLMYGAFAFGKILTDRPIPTIDERVEFMKTHGALRSSYERTENIRQYAVSRRPRLMLSFGSSVPGDCEAFRETAEFALSEAWNIAEKYPDFRPVSSAPTYDPKDPQLVDSYTMLATTMVDAYDNCLGNP